MTIVLIIAPILRPALVAATTWHVPGDAPTIQAAINLASPGDDVLVAPATYFEYEIVMKPAVWVHSEEGPDATIVNPAGIAVGFTATDLQESTTLEGFTILNGRADRPGQHGGSGGGVRCVNSILAIRDCVIGRCWARELGGGIYAWESEIEVESCTVVDCSTDYGGGGILAYASTVTISDCEVLNNAAVSAGGILASGPEVVIVRCIVSGNSAAWGSGGGISCASSTLMIRDCLINNNRASLGPGGGLVVWYSSGVIAGCTVANNRGTPGPGGVVFISSGIEIERTISAFNEGRAIECSDSQVVTHCCDLYGNTQGDKVCGEDLGGNFSADPLFCDAGNGDYTLDANSPCLPGNHPGGIDCGLIGARGQGCGEPTTTRETTWGHLKMLYRDR